MFTVPASDACVLCLQYQCLVPVCQEKFGSPKTRKKHLIKVHKYPTNFRLEKTRKPNKYGYILQFL